MLKNLSNKYKALPIQVKAALWFLACSFLQKGISTITTPIFTRLMNTAEYGQFNVFNSWLGIITIFVTLRIYHGSYTQGLVKYEEQRNQYVSAMQGLTLTLCIVWTAIYLIFHDYINRLLSLTTIQMLAMMVMIWATAVFNFWAAEQRVLLTYKKLVLVTIIVSIAKPVVGVMLVKAATDKVTARIVGLAIVEFLGYIALFVVQIRRGKKLFDNFFWKRAILLNLPLILHYLSMTVLSSSDRIMIANMVDDDKAGIYSLAYQISQVMTLFSNTLTQTITPWVYQKIKANKVKDISKISYACLLIVVVTNIILILLGPEVVAIFAPPAYYEAIWVIPPVAISVYFMFCYDLFAKFEFYYEKTHYVMIASTIGAVVNILLNYICIKEFGYQAAAYTTLFCYVLYAFAHYIAMTYICNKNLEGIRPYSPKVLLLVSVSFIIVGLLLMITYNYKPIRYSIIIIGLVLSIIERKKILHVVSSILTIRKGKNQEAS